VYLGNREHNALTELSNAILVIVRVYILMWEILFDKLSGCNSFAYNKNVINQ